MPSSATDGGGPEVESVPVPSVALESMLNQSQLSPVADGLNTSSNSSASGASPEVENVAITKSMLRNAGAAVENTL